MPALVLLALSSTVCAPVATASELLGRALAQASPGSGMLRVASSEASEAVLLSEEEVREVAPGTWRGSWSSPTYPSSGEILIKVESARNGEISGSGTSSGGPCPREFRMSGIYQGSLVQMELEFATAGAECTAGAVRISMQMGRQDSKFVGVGHWAEIKGSKPGKELFGSLRLVK